MAPSKSAQTRMLDEIERLRGVTCRLHDVSCDLVRDGLLCSCGTDSRALATITETQLLRAQLVQARVKIEHDRLEILRLDRRVLESLFVPPADDETYIAPALADGTAVVVRGSTPDMLPANDTMSPGNPRALALVMSVLLLTLTACAPTSGHHRRGTGKRRREDVIDVCAN